MSEKKKGLWFLKLHLPFSRSDRKGAQENGSSLIRKTNLTEEYKQAFRTRSYTEICTKIRTRIEGESFINLSEDLEPQQEALNSLTGASKTHQIILVSYFEISHEACRICESLLENVHQVRNDYSAIKAVIMSSYYGGQDVNGHLSSLSRQTNPFAEMTREKFHELHAAHKILLRKLTSRCKKTRRRSEFVKFIRRATAGLLVIGCGALAVAVLILAVHTMAAAPGLVLLSLCLFITRKLRQDRRRRHWRFCKERWMEAMTAQLDIAARGVYILINDFDTMSRVVRRLQDEIEHRRLMADMCVRKSGKGSCEMVREVAREFEANEGWFQEQLEELERQIYLCFLDINRSRRMLVREMVDW